MFNFEEYLPVLLLACFLLLLLVIILFFIHRRNNKIQLQLLEKKLFDLPDLANQQQYKQFDTFKQGLQQLINDLSKRIKSNEHRIADIMNQLEEMEAMDANMDDEVNATKPGKKDLTNDLEN